MIREKKKKEESRRQSDRSLISCGMEQGRKKEEGRREEVALSLIRHDIKTTCLILRSQVRCRFALCHLKSSDLQGHGLYKTSDCVVCLQKLRNVKLGGIWRSSESQAVSTCFLNLKMINNKVQNDLKVITVPITSSEKCLVSSLYKECRFKALLHWLHHILYTVHGCMWKKLLTGSQHENGKQSGT